MPRTEFFSQRSRTMAKTMPAAEVTRISEQGLSLLAGNRELFLPYTDFPWFRNAPLAAIYNVRESVPGHLYWPDLDIDLEIESIEYPERFPLKYK
jgi:hypothetical protein